MHDDYLQQQMESAIIQKVLGIGVNPSTANTPYNSVSALSIDDPDTRQPPHKRFARDTRQEQLDENFQPKHTEFSSTSIADFFDLNGQPGSRINFSSNDLAFPLQQQTNSETWARLLAAGTSAGLSPFGQLDEAFVEIFADKVANKVVHALSPQIQQIRTAIIGLARLVELTPTTLASTIEKRTQSPPTPTHLHHIQSETLQQSHVSGSLASSTPQPTSSIQVTVSSAKKRNQSPSKAETQGIPVNENEAPMERNLKSSATKASNISKNDVEKKEKKTADGKSNPKRSVKEVPDVYRIIKLDDLSIHFNMTEKLCLLCRETFTESHLHSVKRHMYRKHRNELDNVLQKKTSDPILALAATLTGERPQHEIITIVNMKDEQEQNELIDVVDVTGREQMGGRYHQQSGIPL